MSEINKFSAQEFFQENGLNPINSGTIESNPLNHRNMSQIIMADYTTRVSTLENTVNTISQEVKDIKQNYLTTSAFYRSGIVALVMLVGASWALYSHMDTKYENRFSAIDQRFEKVESNIHSLDVRLTKVESRLDNVELRLTNVEKKLDNIDDKLDILIQQKQAKNN
ncbi:hypothetical protein BKK49_06985 [Rodentibacter rarus]|uniref:hypothetical protein n=1 Tax=Rodentibacter rarus TaxID=1908260 RepID=UPI0009876517|nr:hypothetical protein [Rodentibacter rarus]OOF39864.1 hypothetical protein BKK49_06985 [Rodentibacter rarus]